jgi:hypothetical protein
VKTAWPCRLLKDQFYETKPGDDNGIGWRGARALAHSHSVTPQLKVQRGTDTHSNTIQGVLSAPARSDVHVSQLRWYIRKLSNGTIEPRRPHWSNIPSLFRGANQWLHRTERDLHGAHLARGMVEDSGAKPVIALGHVDFEMKLHAGLLVDGEHLLVGVERD